MTTVPLGDVATINPRGDSAAASDLISFVGMAQLDARTAVATPLETRQYAEVSKGYTTFRDNDILVAKITPCWENGKVGQARLDHPIGVGSTEFHVVRPTPVLDDRYALHFLRQPRIRQAGEMRMTGSGGQKRVPAAYLSELAIPLPPLEEQRRIAAILDQADAIRAKRRQVLAHLNDLTQAIFHDMFGGHPQVTVRLGDLAEIQGGLQVSAKRATLLDGILVPYLRVANSHRGRLDLAEIKFIRATQSEVDRTRLAAGDLLVVEGHANPLEIGRVSRWDNQIDGCIHQNHLIRVRVDPARVLPVFAEAWLNSEQGAAHFRRAGNTTSGLNTISAETVRSAPIFTPPMSRQMQFQEHLNFVAAACNRAATASLQATELFAALQAHSFHASIVRPS